MSGLLPLKPDKRDFKVGAVFDLPKLTELPASYNVGDVEVKDQGGSDFCAAFASCSVSELQEGVTLSPEYVFACAKELTGDVDEFGLDLRDVAKAHVKVGAIEQSDAPFSIADHSHIFLRRIENWPDLKMKALIHSKGSYLAVDGPYSPFDNIRAAMWKFRSEKRAVFLGVEWSWSWQQIEIDTAGNGSGHAIFVTGWTERNGKEYLVIQNSYGVSCGDNGKFYISRDVINKYIPKYGAYMFSDLTKEEYNKRVMERNKGIISKILDAMMKILGLIKAEAEKNVIEEPVPVAPVVPVVLEKPIDPPPQLPPPKYDWSTRDTVKKSIRIICDEMGLTLQGKNLICAVIQAESGFNTKAINKNLNGTTDWGLCQFNDGASDKGVPYWIGKGAALESTDEVLNNPEKCVRVMIRQYLAGNLHYWVGYKSGAYKKYL